MTQPDPLPLPFDAPGLPTAAALGAALTALVGQTGMALALKDAGTGRLVWANAAYAELFGSQASQLIGRVEADLIDDGQRAPFRDAEQSVLAGDLRMPSEHRLERNGRRRDFRVARVALQGDAAAPRLLASLWIETTAAQQREQQLKLALAQIEQQQAAAEAARREAPDPSVRDQVTGLYQRGQFDDLLRREVDLSLREHREFALAAIEVDPPGDEMAALGPGAEQRVLEAVGRLLRGNTRAMDASCRIDTRRFAVLLSGVGLATAHSRMESMRRQCATQIVVLDGRNFGFTVAMGVASFPHTAHSQEELMRAADAALAEARRRGGNHVTLASIRFEGS
jgi:diguanylate cyclase (GGDEF)-like protein